MKMYYNLASHTPHPTGMDLSLQRRRPPLGADRDGRWASLLQQARSALQAVSARIRSPRLRAAALVGLIALCLIPVVRQAAQDWDAVSLLARQVQAPAVLASALALILASLFLPTAMAALTRGAPRRISLRDSALAYYASQPMNYLPGSFWILPGRVILLRGLGHDVSLSSAALFFEMTTQVFSSSLVAAVLIGLTGFTSAWYREAAWLILAGSLAVSLFLLVRAHAGPADAHPPCVSPPGDRHPGRDSACGSYQEPSAGDAALYYHVAPDGRQFLRADCGRGSAPGSGAVEGLNRRLLPLMAGGLSHPVQPRRRRGQGERDCAAIDSLRGRLPGHHRGAARQGAGAGRRTGLRGWRMAAAARRADAGRPAQTGPGSGSGSRSGQGRL